MKTNRRSYLAIAVAISILPGTFLGVSAQPRSSQYSVVKELKEGVIQVRVEGKSYLLLPVKPATIIEDETYVAATLASEGPIDSNETYLGLTTADAKEALKMKVDLDEAKQKLALMDQRIASFQEEREQYEAALRLKDEAVGQMELALDQKN